MAVFLVICTLAVAAITSGTRYEYNSTDIAYQNESDFTAVLEVMFVTKQDRNAENTSKTLCQAVMKLRHYAGNSFMYIAYVAAPSTPTKMKAFVTTLTTNTSALENVIRFQPDAFSYYTSGNGLDCTYEVIYANVESGCFILNRSGPACLTGCRLLQTASKVNHGIPPECNRIYMANCSAEVKQIYHPICPLRLPHIVQGYN